MTERMMQDAKRVAEMLQFGHGTDAVDDRTPTRRGSCATSCFNSATALTPWMTCTPRWCRMPTSALQFGHGTDAVDDVATAIGLRRQGWLQFGHGTDAVD